MELLRELMRLQHERGWLSDDTLREVAADRRIPLYRLEGLASFYAHFRRRPPVGTLVHVCRDVCCASAGSVAAIERLRNALGNRSDVEIAECSCLGRCDSAPACSIDDAPVAPATLQDIDAILDSIDGKPAETAPCPAASPRFQCDPYDDVAGHYSTVSRMLAAAGNFRTDCIEPLLQSGLRGMGGAGFPTGRKWELVAAESRSPKYVICNADESEPGTFKDRDILAQLPHLVIEGMLLSGLAICAEQGIVYIRHEYDPERESLEAAIADARSRGALGENACGSGRRFDIDVFVSPGGYILGEETALLEALEDKRGEPRNKPPYPGTHGLWGQPTLINNVETFALATSIVHHGVDWWNAQAAEGFSGLKFVCISGDVERPGVFEIPMGTTVAELIERAGGMREGRSLQAFLPGGASSKFLPAAAVDTPLDFDAVKQAGSMLGTGAVIVFDDTRDLYDAATNVTRFFRNESCGKCVPCRIGTHQAVELLQAVQAGETDRCELATLVELGDTLEQTSICGLGQVALTPVLSMLERFDQQPDIQQPQGATRH